MLLVLAYIVVIVLSPIIFLLGALLHLLLALVPGVERKVKVAQWCLARPWRYIHEEAYLEACTEVRIMIHFLHGQQPERSLFKIVYRKGRKKHEDSFPEQVPLDHQHHAENLEQAVPLAIREKTRKRLLQGKAVEQSERSHPPLTRHTEPR